MMDLTHTLWHTEIRTRKLEESHTAPATLWGENIAVIIWK
jgi:hypothetical protein